MTPLFAWQFIGGCHIFTLNSELNSVHLFGRFTSCRKHKLQEFDCESTQLQVACCVTNHLKLLLTSPLPHWTLLPPVLLLGCLLPLSRLLSNDALPQLWTLLYSESWQHTSKGNVQKSHNAYSEIEANLRQIQFWAFG